jgi:hypothetical protein
MIMDAVSAACGRGCVVVAMDAHNWNSTATIGVQADIARSG